MGKPKVIFYGWIMVGVTAFGSMILYGIRHSFSVFFSPILNEFGWSRGNTAIMLSLNIFIYGLLAPVVGWLIDRWKSRYVVSLGIIALALAMLGCTFSNQLWHFYLLFGLLAPIGTAFAGWPVSGSALMNWFIKRRGLVMGLGVFGGGFSFVFAIFAELIILKFGWRIAYLILAGILLSILLPLYFLFFRYRPEEKGLQPLGMTVLPTSGENGNVGKNVKRPHPPRRSLREVLKTRELWMLTLSNCLYWGMGSYLVLAHQVRFAEDIGYSSLFAVSVFALYGILMIFGQLSGFLSDRWGRERTVTLATLLSVGALCALVAARDTSQPYLLYLYCILFGYGTGLYSPTIFAAAADLFHGQHYAVVLGLLLAGMGVGGAIGPWLGGFLYDLSGTYTTAFIVSMVSMTLGCATVWIAAPRKAAKMGS